MSAVDTIHKSFSRPIFDYCDIVWTCNKVDAERLERLQNCAAKVTYLSQSSDDVMAVLRWTPLYKKREHHVFKLVKKSLAGLVPQFLMNYITYNRDIHGRETRQSN